MKYKIRYFVAFWNTYNIIRIDIFNFLDNEVLGKILAYFLYYLILIIGFVPMVVVAICKTLVEAQLICKKRLKENNMAFIELALKHKLIKEKRR